MRTMYPVVTANSTGGLAASNDAKHNKKDLRGGGGPAFRNRKKVAPAHRGGFGMHGQVSRGGTAKGNSRGSSGNPADRGSVRPVGRQSTPSEVRNPNAGGGVQVRDNFDTVRRGGGFGMPGQTDVPTAASNPKPGAGNLSGRMAKRISGRFNQDSKGSKAGGLKGKFGGPPIRLDT